MLAASGPNVPCGIPVTEPPRPLREFTRAEVERESSTGARLLIILEDGVYDVTEFRKVHPGGEDILWSFAGRDASSAFESISHSTRAHNMLDKFKVGYLVKRP
jgi:cytochrome b involved in lipid metabolism